MKKFLSAMMLAVFFSAGVGLTANAYEVKQGDTLSKIADAHDLSLWEISTLNPQIVNLDLIYIGDQIKTVHDGIGYTLPSPPPKAVQDISQDHQLLAQLVYAEARGESFEGKVAVAEVVLNRVNDPQFPNTIKGVIYQPRQFVPASSGSIHNSPDPESVKAVQVAMSGSNYTNGALYFYNAQTATNRWLDGLPTITVIDSHTFK